jgi:hypothetical protein
MNERFDRDTSAIERMLHDRTLQQPPAALRTRVLTAVDAVLHDDRPVRRLEPAGTFPWLVGGALMTTALSLVLVVTLSSELSRQRIGAMSDQPLLSFAKRAAVAGVTLDVMPPPAVQLAVGQPYDAAIPLPRDTFHVLDTRSFLQGDL